MTTTHSRTDASNTSTPWTVSVHMSLPAQRLKMSAPLTMALPCWTPALAAEFADYLRQRGVEVSWVRNDTVAVPFGGSERFAVEVTTAAVFGEFADAEQMADVLAEVSQPTGHPMIPLRVAA